MHSASDYHADTWNNLFRDDDMDKVAVDIHDYQAFLLAPNFKTAQDACDEYETRISW
jgi:hypothetical protein